MMSAGGAPCLVLLVLVLLVSSSGAVTGSPGLRSETVPTPTHDVGAALGRDTVPNQAKPSPIAPRNANENWSAVTNSSAWNYNASEAGAAIASSDGEGPTLALAFGGYECPRYPGCSGGPQVTNDTWVFTGGAWQEPVRSPGTPPARVDASLVFMPTLDEYVLFGGISAKGTYLNDTWTYSGGQWTNVTGPWGPTPRAGTAMAYVPGDQSILLFGGEGPGDVVLGDSWLLDFNGSSTYPTWEQAFGGDPTPSPRAFASIASNGFLVYLYGGLAPDLQSGLQDTWVFGGAGWTNVTNTVGSSPNARWGAEFTYSSFLGAFVLFSGCDAGLVWAGAAECSSSPLGGTWTFSGTLWAMDPAVSVPPSRVGGALIESTSLAPYGGVAMLIGGATTGGVLLNDTWQFPGPGASPLAVNFTSNAVWAAAPPESVVFTSTVQGGSPPYSYLWSFGDGGGPSADANPDHTYNSTGIFTPSLTVCDTVGTCAQTPGSPIALTSTGDILTAEEGVSPQVGSLPLTVRLQGYAFGGTPGYFFNWSVCGPGVASNQSGCEQFTTQSRSIQLNESANYSVYLRVSDHGGLSTYNASWVNVTGEFGPLQLQAAVTPTTGTAPLGVTLTTSAWGGVTSPSYPVYNYSVNWGDGTPLQAISGDHENLSHTYSYAGNYSGTVYVSDEVGHTARQGFGVVVSPAPGGPTLTLEETPTGGPAPLSVHFEAEAVGGTGPFEFTFISGNGFNETLREPQGVLALNYTYVNLGVYTPGFVVVDAYGLGAESWGQVTVANGTGSSPLSVSVTVENGTGPAPLNVTLVGQAEGGTAPYTFYWDLGDGSVTGCYDESTCVESTLYFAPGYYNGSLTVEDSYGNLATTPFSVLVTPQPSPTPLVVQRTITPTSGPAPLTVGFSASASGSVPPYHYQWSVTVGGSVITSEDSNWSYTFVTPGIYEVSLSVSTSYAGEVSTATITVLANATAHPAPRNSQSGAGELEDIGVGLIVVLGLIVALVAWQRLGRSRRFEQLDQGAYAPSYGMASPGGPVGPGNESGVLPRSFDPYSSYRVPPTSPPSSGIQGADLPARARAGPGTEPGPEESAFSGMI